MRRVAKITDGPVGAGTRYEMEFLPGRPIIAECVRFDPPPASWEVAGSGSGMRVWFSGRVTPVLAGARLEFRMEIEPRGLLRAALPPLRRRMPRDLARDIALIKAWLERPAEPSRAGRDWTRLPAVRRPRSGRSRPSTRWPGSPSRRAWCTSCTPGSPGETPSSNPEQDARFQVQASGRGVIGWGEVDDPVAEAPYRAGDVRVATRYV
jgi:hypothetical protein